MKTEWSDIFDRYIDRASGAKDSAEARQLAVVLSMVNELEHEPAEDSAYIQRIKQRTRNELWRVSHPYHPEVAIRLIVWFHNGNAVVLVAVGGNKLDSRYRDPRTGQDRWYDYFVPLADDVVDDYLKHHP